FAICCTLLLTLRIEWRWRGVFVATAGGRLMMIVAALSAWLDFPLGAILSLTYSPWAMLFWFLVLVAIAVWDILASARRDWLHWVGVSVNTGYSALSILWLLVVLSWHWY